MKLVVHLFQHDRILDNNPVGNVADFDGLQYYIILVQYNTILYIITDSNNKEEISQPENKLNVFCPPCPDRDCTQLPGSKPRGKQSSLNQTKRSSNSSVDTLAGDAGIAFTLFYLSAVLIVLVGIGALVGKGAICGRASAGTSAGISAGTTPDTADHVTPDLIPQTFFASESHRLNTPLTMVLASQLLDFVKTLEIRVFDFALGNLSAVGIA